MFNVVFLTVSNIISNFAFCFSYKTTHEDEDEKLFPGKGENLLQWAVRTANGKDVGLEIIKMVAEKAHEKDSNVANYQTAEKYTCLHIVAEKAQEFSENIIGLLMKEPYNARANIPDINGRNASTLAKLRNHDYAAWFMK